MSKLLIVTFALGCGPPPAPAPIANKPAPQEAPIAIAPAQKQRAEITVDVAALASPTTGGTIAGTITDDHGEALAGVTVVVASPAMTGEQTAMSDENGEFEIATLVAGTYTVSAYYLDSTLVHTVEVTDQRLTRIRIARWKLGPQELDR